jgi:hypothetical protein
MEHGPNLKRNEQGRLDVRALEQDLSEELLRQWLRDRLRGRDPYWPVDHDNLETPEQVFIDLWHRASPGSMFRELLGRVCRELLQEAWASRRRARWHAPLLSLVAAIQPPHCAGILNSIVSSIASATDHTDTKTDRRWLFAAAAYRPPQPELVPVWRDLLQHPEYGTVAYRALARDPELGISFLPAYWSALPEEHRSLLFERAVQRIAGEVEQPLERLRHRAELDGWTTSVRSAVDAALRKLEYPRLFEAELACAPTDGVPPVKLTDIACLAEAA